MFDFDRWQEIYYVLKKNRLRTFLTAFGVFWGIFMLMIMLGAGTGLQNGTTQNFGDMATNSVFIWAQQTTVPYKGFPRGRRFNYRNEDVKALRTEIPEIKYLAPRLRGGNFGEGNNVMRGLKTGLFNINGEYPDLNRIDPLNMLKGRFINEMDIEQVRKVVVIGTGVQDAMFGKEEEPLGQYLQINGVYFQVVGLFRSKRTGEQANDENKNIFMPFTTLQRTYNYGGVVGVFAITSQDNISVTVAEDKAIDLLKRRHSVAPSDDGAIGHFNLEKEFRKMTGLFFGIRLLVWIVGTGTLLAGVIGVSNIMLVVVKERTKEIGIQRALGATPVKIIGQIMTESVVLTILAGYLGLVAGVGLLEGLNYLMESSGSASDMFLHPGVDFRVAMTALSILVIAGMLAGLIPARRAVTVKPIDALRYET
ncbi:MAG: ABC transporter permease [Bacteroidetes bacterium]|nr:ABC transporter permease [Bacteroidota bacterium]